MTDLTQLTIQQANDLLCRWEISSVELTEAVLDRIVAVDNDVKAYLTVTPEAAMEQAAEADGRRAAASPEETSPLLGIPLAIKDVISVRGTPTTCGSRILEGYVPPFDATVIE